MSSVYRETFAIEGGDFGHAGAAASRVKQILKEIGLDSAIVKRAVIIAYEAEINLVSYAQRGQLTVVVSPSKIQILVEDEGPGIEDVELAMQEGYSTASEWIREMGFGAGMGLPNIKKNADLLHIDSRIGEGTKVSAEVLMDGPGGAG
jgi:anti-sigma regulatory factor (Ser/Thr protein kinase)